MFGAQDAPHYKSPSTIRLIVESKLAQAYDMLVPGRERLIGGGCAMLCETHLLGY